MNINPIPSVSSAGPNEAIHIAEEPISTDNLTNIVNSTMDPETRQALDHATGLLQTIVTEKLSDKVIRKMPSDEYLHLLSLLDEIISGSIDKHV
ncbi:hypothetical protein [uncultured Legionella sp.]|uniref:hypothetical protein n=1 Tax=uncultured Legionella sp. TaxID=210934 RepID=UPI002635FB0A|nr:hypothetical protein [uncultured Legionella sp.]